MKVLRIGFEEIKEKRKAPNWVGEPHFWWVCSLNYVLDVFHSFYERECFYLHVYGTQSYRAQGRALDLLDHKVVNYHVGTRN